MIIVPFALAFRAPLDAYLQIYILLKYDRGITSLLP